MNIENITTDAGGNCYLIGSSIGQYIIKKINPNGLEDWVITSDSVAWYNATVNNDTVFICGSSVDGGTNSSIRKSAVSIYSQLTNTLTTHFFDVIPAKVELADHILKSESNIYITGIGGDYMGTLFVAKINFSNAVSIIEQSLQPFQLAIYPNPASCNVNITGNLIGASIKVCDLSGRVVYCQSLITTDDFKIEMPELSKGVYFVEVNKENTSQTRKVIIQ